MPIVVGAVLEHLAIIGPAEIPAKRDFSYAIVQWRADTDRIPLRFLPMHPFRPMAALRLAIACATSWEVIAAIFDHLWARGEVGDADSLAGVAAQLCLADVHAVLGAAAVNEELRANTDEAIANRVFGVPSGRIGKRLFWGNDETAMIEQFIADPSRFENGEYARIATLQVGIERAR